MSRRRRRKLEEGDAEIQSRDPHLRGGEKMKTKRAGPLKMQAYKRARTDVSHVVLQIRFVDASRTHAMVLQILSADTGFWRFNQLPCMYKVEHTCSHV